MNTTDTANQRMADMMNKMVEKNPELASLFVNRSASYRYYTAIGSKDKYFYTVRKIDRKGSMRYVSGIYRYLKSRKQWKLVKSSQAGHAKKKDAIARAEKLSDKKA